MWRVVSLYTLISPEWGGRGSRLQELVRIGPVGPTAPCLCIAEGSGQLENCGIESSPNYVCVGGGGVMV